MREQSRAHLGDGRGDRHARSEENGQDGNVAGRRGAARERHEVVPEVRKRQRGARQPRGVPRRQLGHHALPQRAQLLRSKKN